jgi:hypothetical protein
LTSPVLSWVLVAPDQHDKVIADQAEMPALRKNRGLIMQRPIFEMEPETAGDTISPSALNEIAVSRTQLGGCRSAAVITPVAQESQTLTETGSVAVRLSANRSG